MLVADAALELGESDAAALPFVAAQQTAAVHSIAAAQLDVAALLIAAAALHIVALPVVAAVAAIAALLVLLVAAFLPLQLHSAVFAFQRQVGTDSGPKKAIPLLPRQLRQAAGQGRVATAGQGSPRTTGQRGRGSIQAAQLQYFDNSPVTDFLGIENHAVLAVGDSLLGLGVDLPEPADCPHSCTAAAAADTDNFDAEIDLNSPAGSADNFLLVKNSAVAAVPPVVVDKPEHQMS